MAQLTSIEGYTVINGVPMIDPGKLRVIEQYNVREDFDPHSTRPDGTPLVPADAELYLNMQTNGFIADKPITVRIVETEGKAVAYIIAGHRRAACANLINRERLERWKANGGKKADKPELIRGVSFIPEAKGADGAERSLVEMTYDLELSNSGKPLSPAERGAMMLRLKGMGETDDTIAKRLGMKDTRWVKDLCKLANADKRLRALVKAGVITPTHAVLLPRAHGEAKGTEIAIAAGKAALAEGKISATGKDIAKAEIDAGVAPKVGNKGKADKAPSVVPERRGMKSTVAPLAKVGKGGTSTVTINGPFHLGTDLDDCTLFDSGNNVLCEWPDEPTAKAMLRIVNLGWSASQGVKTDAATTVDRGPVTKAEPRAIVIPDEPDLAKVAQGMIAANAAKAEREAARKARVTAQMEATATEREASAKAARDMAATMGKGKAQQTRNAAAMARHDRKVAERGESDIDPNGPRANVETVIAAKANARKTGKASKANASK